MSIYKQRHVCSRCGNEWLERTSAYYDELVEWIHHADRTEHELRREAAHLALRAAKAEEALEHARSLAENFEALAKAWQRLAEEREECPF